MKFEYGAGPANDNGASPALWLSIGKGSNGEGVLNNVLISRVLIDTNGDGASQGASSCYFCGASNFLTYGLFTGSGFFANFMALERTKDAAGNDTSNGLLLTVKAASTRINAYLPMSSSVPPPQNETGIFTPVGVSSGQ